MGWLLPALSAERFETQRGVVLNERRQSYENRPYGLAQFAIMEALFPPPIRTAGRRSGVPRISRPRRSTTCAQFFARYYHPANASLVIAGDVGADEALAHRRGVVRRDSGGPGR